MEVEVGKLYRYKSEKSDAIIKINCRHALDVFSVNYWRFNSSGTLRDAGIGMVSDSELKYLTPYTGKAFIKGKKYISKDKLVVECTKTTFDTDKFDARFGSINITCESKYYTEFKPETMITGETKIKEIIPEGYELDRVGSPLMNSQEGTHGCVDVWIKKKQPSLRKKICDQMGRLSRPDTCLIIHPDDKDQFMREFGISCLASELTKATLMGMKIYESKDAEKGNPKVY